MSDVHVSGLKKEPAARDAAVSPVASSLASTSVSSRLNSSRAVSTSHLDAVQLRQPAVNLQRRGESAVSRLAPKMTAPYPQLSSSSATESRLGSDSANNQRVIEWQMKNQMAKGNESLGQVPPRFENEPNPTGPTVTISSEQKPNYYSARPQSQLMEPGYVMPGPTNTASPLPQSTSMPVVTDNVVGNRDQTSVGFGQQPAVAESYSVSTPVYSDDQRYTPQQPQPSIYDHQSAISGPPQFSHVANVRPQMPEMVRQSLPGMVPRDLQHPGPNVRSNLPFAHQQPAVTGSGTQYRPPGGQYGLQAATSNVEMTAPGVLYDLANVGGRMPAVSNADGMPVHSDGVHYVGPDNYDRRSVPQQDVRYEMANVESRAVPAGVPFTTDSGPYTAHEGFYRPPHIDRARPTDVYYGTQNVAGVMPSMRPVVPNLDAERKLPQAGVRYGMPNVGGHMPPAPSIVRYDSSSSEDRLVEAVPGSHDMSRDQSSTKLSQHSGYYEAPNTASQEAPYQIYNTSGSTSVVPANIRYDASHPSNTGDNWPLPPKHDHYAAPNVQNEFSVPLAVSIQPQSGQVSAPQLQIPGDSSKPLPTELQHVFTPVPSLPPGMPANDVRPKKQPPPVAAKPKLPVSTGLATKPKEITKDEGRQLKPEKMQQKMLEIQRLESRPYLTANEQTKLRNFRVEVEFNKRLADLDEKREDGSDLEQSRMFPPMVRFLLTLSRKICAYLIL